MKSMSKKKKEYLLGFIAGLTITGICAAILLAVFFFGA